MKEKEKTAELTKILSLVKRLMNAVDANPARMKEAGLIYSEIKNWYHNYKKNVKDVS